MKYMFNYFLLQQLYNLCVQLRHTVPPQHEIERRAGSHMPTQKEIEKFEEIVSIKRGSYSSTEDNIIASNWKAFCKVSIIIISLF